MSHAATATEYLTVDAANSHCYCTCLDCGTEYDCAVDGVALLGMPCPVCSTIREIEGLDGEGLYYYLDVLPRIEAGVYVALRDQGMHQDTAVAVSRDVVATRGRSMVLALQWGVPVSDLIEQGAGWMAR